MPPLEPESRLNVVPEKSSISAISLTEIASRELQEVISIWRTWCRDRPMPERDDVVPRGLGRLLPSISIVRVVRDEQDYEFRIIGGAHTQAYGVSQQSKKLSDVIVQAPGFGRRLKASLDEVVETLAPVAYRGKIGRDVGEARFVWLETVFLPVGGANDGVDHVMIATVYAPLGGVWPN
jgi:hypothetical protein